MKHRIDPASPDTSPMHSSPYRAGPLQRQVDREEVNKMLQYEVAESVTKAWGSPVIFVQQKDGSFRFIVEYRQLNGTAVSGSYPIPKIDDFIDLF